MDEDHWYADELEYQNWLKSWDEDLLRLFAKREVCYNLEDDELITLPRRDLLALMSEENREKYIEAERLAKELMEENARIKRENEDLQKETPLRKGWRQPRRKKGSKKLSEGSYE